MILFFYFLLNLAALFLFTKKKKKLHILEILVYWLIASYLYQNFSALCYMNFKTLIVPDKLSLEFSHFFNRIILFPIVMVFFLDYFLILKSLYKKIALIISFICLLSGLEWLANFLGVLIHVHWRIWWTFAYWLTTLFVLIVFMKFFRKILYKGE